MNRKQKKGLKVAGGCLAAVLVLMLVIPFFFEGKVADIVKSEGNKMLNARLDFGKLSISLFRDFPKASVSLEDFYLVGADEFQRDTLVRAGEVSVSVDVLSLFSDNFEIGKIALSDATVHAIVLENGKANWDVMKPDTATVQEETPEEAGETGSFGLSLKKLSVENLNVTYNDYQSDMHASIEGFTADCSGDFNADETNLDLSAAIRRLSFRMGMIPYLADAEIETEISLLADFKNGKYTLQDNTFRLNAIETSIDGWVAMPDTTRMEMDLKLNTNEIGFKELLSLIPAIYQKDFADLKTDGTALLTAMAKGTLQGDSILPAFDVALDVKNAKFQYPSLPAGVDGIQIHARAHNPGGNADGTVVEIKPFSFRMAGMPFSLNAVVKTPVSDPDFQATATGTIRLDDIKKVYPLEEGSNLSGTLTADVQMGGRMSYLEKEQYEKFQAAGTLSLKNMLLKMKEMQDVQIKQSTLSFSPQYVKLSQTEVILGKNDFALDCTLSNYLAYVLKGKTIQGTVNLTSNYLNLNDFSGSAEETPAEETTEQPAAESTEMGVIEVPRNVDFRMNANLKKILFDTMTFEDVNGLLVIKDGTVDMQNLSLRTMGGGVVVNGAYSTAESVKKPKINGAFKLDRIAFAQAYKELNMVRSVAPIFENLKGHFSGSMQLAADLDEHLSPVPETMNGGGTLSTGDINLADIDILEKIAAATKKTDLLQENVKDLNVHFNLVNGKLITEPFTLKIGSKYALQMEGTTSLDKTIDYTASISLPGSENSMLSSIGLKIGGTFSSPKISVDTKSMAKQAATSAAQKALGSVSEKLGIDLTSAQKQKDALVAEAEKAGQELVDAAQKQADKLMDDAGSNLLRKAAAKKAGEALVKEAQKQADKLKDEASKKGDELISKLQSGQ